MKSLVRVCVVGAMAGWTALCAQNFNGSDNFSSVVAGNWSSDTTSGGGLFTVSGNVLNFTDGGLSTGTSSLASRSWILNAGSYNADWQVQVDVTINLSQAASQMTFWSLNVVNNADPTDNARLTFQQSYLMTPPHSVIAGIYTNNTGGMSMPATTAVSTVTLRADYTAATHYLALGFDAGSGYALITGANINSSPTDWAMNSGNTFGVSLLASNSDNAFAIPALTSGMFADNFLATGTAIPESSTYAAGFGFLALLVAIVRRRGLA